MELPKRRFSKPLRLSILAVYWIGIFTLTHIPISIPVSAPKNSDKVAHFLMYLGLALLSGWYSWATVNRDRFRAKLATWLVVLLSYAAFDEWLQQFVHRTMSFNDWLADAAGLFFGALLLILASRRSQYRNNH